MWNQEEMKGERRQGDDKSRVATLGGSVFVKGEISGSEDLTIDGQVEGRIQLPDHALTIGPNATIVADITAKVVTIFGSVDGNVTARERVDVRSSASVEGTVTCAKVSIQEGAHVCGKVETTAGKKSSAGSKSERQALAPVA